MQKVLQPLYYAREDTRSPFRFAVVAMVVNVVLAIGLSPVIGYLAAAVATSAAGWAMMALLWRGARDMGPAAEVDDRLRRRVWRILAASAGLGAVLILGEWALRPLAAITRGGALALLVIGGSALYFVFSHLLDAFRFSELRSAMRRG
jgi:putative peptidoglycan lipid II flippase